MIPSAIQPVPHTADMPIPDPPKKYEIEKDYVKEEFIKLGTSHDPDFEAEDLNESRKLNQAKLRDLVRDPDLPKQKADLLASRLQYTQWNLLLPGVKITEYRTRETNLLNFFEKNMWLHVLMSMS
ncbi:hypothetical protein TNCT_379631 [Trichonephila clavata]|uniref:Uncharacterized protein n=1 Tax=Trichonephila clavata TaxID=2740835 RepID=A0A8X6KIE2_TRICU|nr:hypothetical protein TNCT_379631 [Trichonephila clavata]